MFEQAGLWEFQLERQQKRPRDLVTTGTAFAEAVADTASLALAAADIASRAITTDSSSSWAAGLQKVAG